jgi:hypothetical protein
METSWALVPVSDERPLTPHPERLRKSNDTDRTKYMMFMTYLFLFNIEPDLLFRMGKKNPPAITSGGSADIGFNTR